MKIIQFTLGPSTRKVLCTYTKINYSHSTATSHAVQITDLQISSAWRVDLTTNCHLAVTFSRINMCINLTLFEVGS